MTAGIDRLGPSRRPDRLALFHQDWQHLAFLHWQVAPEVVAGHLPPGLQVDTYGGRAYLGLVPFTMRRVRPLALPPVPGLSAFHECNLRTYVLDGQGRPGVWFYSLDAASRAGVALGRLAYGLPYFFARMDLDAGPDGTVRYRSRRARPGGAGCDLAVAFQGPARAAEPGTLEHFLVERYLLFSLFAGRLHIGQVHHAPYRIHPATLLYLQEDLLAAAGFQRPPGDPLVLHSDGVSVEVFGLRRA